MKPGDLDDRIAAAFVDGVTSENLKVVIAEAQAASLASGEAADHARERALDPALTAKAVAEARRWRTQYSGANDCKRRCRG